MRLGLTIGEPAGIGGDLILQINPEQLPCPIVLFADPLLLQARAKILNVPFQWQEYRGDTTAKNCWMIHTVPQANLTKPGKLDVANVKSVLTALEVAVKKCLSKELAGVVTGPVHKAIINQAGVQFTGQTEFVAKLCKVEHPVMMLVSGEMRIALVTTHLPLAQVPTAITKATVEQTIRVVQHDLVTRFGIAEPKILVCGLNPHAGENGYLGREEIEIITPVLNKLRKENFSLTGPVPADTAFTPKLLLQHDVIVTMFHDQGLPVLKYHGFGSGVNVTLGLPIIRTSVDHGTALELAGTGTADSGSLLLAIQLAYQMAQPQ